MKEKIKLKEYEKRMIIEKINITKKNLINKNLTQ